MPRTAADASAVRMILVLKSFMTFSFTLIWRNPSGFDLSPVGLSVGDLAFWVAMDVKIQKSC
jgi:hypothetical protein